MVRVVHASEWEIGPVHRASRRRTSRRNRPARSPSPGEADSRLPATLSTPIRLARSQPATPEGVVGEDLRSPKSTARGFSISSRRVLIASAASRSRAPWRRKARIARSCRPGPAGNASRSRQATPSIPSSPSRPRPSPGSAPTARVGPDSPASARPSGSPPNCLRIGRSPVGRDDSPRMIIPIIMRYQGF
jgi:hypothetical protein